MEWGRVYWVSWVRAKVSKEAGQLFVVATPIGNLEDMSPRAVSTLEGVSVIAAEDTRHTRGLLQYFGIKTPLMALHEHNEQEATPRVLSLLREGKDVALVSDAGTPLISDPGYQLVHACRNEAIRVSPIPGPSAIMAALSASGLATDRFRFEGFLPRKSKQRHEYLQALADEQTTLVFYESSHRIIASLEAIRDVMGGGRQVVIARELSKLHETFLNGGIGEVLERVVADTNQQKGEFVILVSASPPEDKDELDHEVIRILKLLSDELPVKQAAKLASLITGVARNRLYQEAQRLKDA